MIKPNCGLFNIPTATAPTINKGSAVFENEISLSASVLVHILFLRRLPVILAPIG